MVWIQLKRRRKGKGNKIERASADVELKKKAKGGTEKNQRRSFNQKL